MVGGAGLKMHLLNSDGSETFTELGMCSQWTSYGSSFLTETPNANGEVCTPGSSTASTTINIPVGTLGVAWILPGDYWGEISFNIKNSLNAVVAQRAVSQTNTEETITFNSCQ